MFAIAIEAGDSVKYPSFVYGSFVWEIHVRYIKVKLSIYNFDVFPYVFYSVSRT